VAHRPFADAAEAGYAVGLRKGQLMRLVLVPQAITVMMPAIVSQLVVLLKDTALGTIIAYDNLTSKVSILQNLYTNAIPAAIVIACVYIPINISLLPGPPPGWNGATAATGSPPQANSLSWAVFRTSTGPA
jgi:hypothetical protein